MNFRPITPEEANIEINAYQHLIQPVRTVFQVIDSVGTLKPNARNFHKHKYNSFIFDKADIMSLAEALSKTDPAITHVMAILGAHVPPRPPQVGSGEVASPPYDEGSPTIILAGVRQDGAEYVVPTAAPLRQYPTQSYTSTISQKEKEDLVFTPE